MKQLAITADDFGLAEKLDEGIKATCHRGAVTHVSLVSNGESVESAAQFLKANPQTSVGAHLNLTDGRPLTEGRFLQCLLDIDGKFFGSHWKVALICARNPSVLKAVEEEYRAQVQRLLDLGIRLTQLNSHGHLHGLPALFRVVNRLASDYAIPFVRVVHEWPDLPDFIDSVPRGFITLLLTSAFGVARKSGSAGGGVRASRCFGIFDSGRLTANRLSKILSRLPEGFSELVCHPGSSDPELEKRFPWNYRWEEESRLINSDWVREEMTQLGIRLVNFSEALEIV